MAAALAVAVGFSGGVSVGPGLDAQAKIHETEPIERSRRCMATHGSASENISEAL